MIVKILAKGFQGEQFELAVKLTRIGIPMIIFSGVIGVITGYLHSEHKFTSSSAIGLPFNFVYIFFLLVLSSRIWHKRAYGISSICSIFSITNTNS